MARGLLEYRERTGDPLPVSLVSWEEPTALLGIPCLYSPHVEEGKLFIVPREEGIELSVAHGIRMLEEMLKGT